MTEDYCALIAKIQESQGQPDDCPFSEAATKALSHSKPPSKEMLRRIQEDLEKLEYLDRITG